jgi:anti-sigma B factor antagonist
MSAAADLPEPFDAAQRGGGRGAVPAHVAYLAGKSTHRVVLSGDIDLALRNALLDIAAAFAQSPAREIDVDLSAVTFLDSTGLSFLVLLRNTCAERDGTVTLVAPSEAASRTLRLVPFDTMFAVREA